jgi:quinol monooxygenase YgiN
MLFRSAFGSLAPDWISCQGHGVRSTIGGGRLVHSRNDRRTMMPYSTLATWYVADGKLDAARAALNALAIEVRKEPGTLVYLVHEPASDSLPPPAPGTIVFFEVYKDEDAFLAHLKGPAFTDFVQAHADLFRKDFHGNDYLQTQHLDRVAGFIRATEVSP